MIEGLPWGEQELWGFKALLHAKVDVFEAGQGVLATPGGSVRSEPTYKYSQAKVRQSRTRIDAFTPAERVLPDHRAEAVKIVYQGLLKAGLVPDSARRKERVGFSG